MTRLESAFENEGGSRTVTRRGTSVTCPGIHTCARPLHRNDPDERVSLSRRDKCPFLRRRSCGGWPALPAATRVIGQADAPFSLFFPFFFFPIPLTIIMTILRNTITCEFISVSGKRDSCFTDQIGGTNPLGALLAA